MIVADFPESVALYSMIDLTVKNQTIKSLDGEEWRQHGSRYWISNKGRVATDNYKNKHELRLMKPGLDKGYPKTVFDGKNNAVHRLVARLFIPNPENKRDVNHIDFNRENNCVDNLEWTTPKENSLHSFNAGRFKSLQGNNNGGIKNPLKGSSVGTAKLTELEVLEIRGKYIPILYSSIKLSKEFNVSKQTILGIINRTSWKHI